MSNALIIPQRDEVEAQLRRILESKRFKGAPSRSNLFQCLVELTLNGIEPKENLILAIAFPEAVYYGGSHVRVGMPKLRASLLAYYAEEGRDDRVVITLPPVHKNKRVKLRTGTAYRPNWRYNSSQEVVRNLSRGRFLADNCLPSQQRAAIDYFVKAGQARPGNPAICYSFALFLLEGVLHEGEDDEVRTVIDSAEQLLTIASAAYSEHYEMHIALAIIALYNQNRASSDAHLERALVLNRHETVTHTWYWEIQFIHGKVEETLSLIRRAVDDQPEALYLQEYLASQLYKRDIHGNYDEAQAILNRVLELDRNALAANAQLLAMYADRKNDVALQDQMKRCRVLFAEEDFLHILKFLGLSYLNVD